jgi:hypothetical protein
MLEVPPQACRGERCGILGRRAPANRLVLERSFLGGLKGSASKLFDALEQSVPELEFAAQGGSDGDGQLVEFESETFVGFQRGGRVFREHVPNLDQEFAGHGGNGDIAVAFSGRRVSSPIGPGLWRGPCAGRPGRLG